MSTFWTGFWAWAKDSPFLSFFLMCSVFKTLRVSFKALCRIWWAPTVGDPDAGPLITIEQATPQAAPETPRPSPVRRRSAWERLLGD